MEEAYSLPILLSVALVLFLTLLTPRVWKTRKNLPPGPPGLPLIGNLLQIPFNVPWVTYKSWARKYGDIIHVSVVGQPLMFLTSPQAVTELFEKRSAIYSDRPELVFCGDLVGYKDSLPLCRYGGRLREHRKLAAEALGPRNTSSWRAIEETKVKNFLGELLETPDSFMDHIRRVIASIAFEISHGYTVSDDKDPMLLLAAEADHNFAKAVTPGAYLCDVLPILRFIPEWTGVRFKQEAKKFRKTMVALRDGPYDSIKEQVAQGTAKPSFTASLVQREENPTAEQEMLYRWSSTSFYAAGADTSVSAIGSLFLAMSLYPEIQKKAQAELDQVIGRDRLPSFEDRPNLPYINAIVTEACVHRWNPVAPLGLPHRCMQDDIYNGYDIPMGTILFANCWGMTHDESIYPSPFQFMPERYSRTENEVDGLNPDPRRLVFGFGRRTCPGQALADDSVFIIAAMALAAFDLRRPEGRGRTIRIHRT
ncbi:cytochrome P450 [Mycena sp. CBHHK59/15]|nr:cytochrome P450 [Mycena sp. CBHHK59/15]